MLGVATIHGRYDHSAWRKSTAFRGGEEVGNYGFRGAECELKTENAQSSSEQGKGPGALPNYTHNQ